VLHNATDGWLLYRKYCDRVNIMNGHRTLASVEPKGEVMFQVSHHFRTVVLTATFAALGALASGTAARANIVSDFSGSGSFGPKYRRLPTLRAITAADLGP